MASFQATPSSAREEFDPSESQERSGFNVSLMLGPGYEGAVLGSPFAVVWGGAAAYKLPSQFEVGLEYESTGGVPTLGGDLNYFFLPHLFVGFQFGLDFDSPAPTTFYLGPQVGFDYPIWTKLYVGPEVQYLYTIHDRGGIFEALLNIKYYL